MARFEIKVDEENGSEQFWDAVREARVGSFEAPLTFLLTWDKVVCEDEDERDQLLSLFRGMPGWSSPDAPKHAPHPLVVVEL